MTNASGGVQGRRQGRLTIRDLGRMVLQDYELNGRRTARRARSSIAHLEPFFGETPAAKIGPLTRSYIAHRLDQGAAAGTVKVELAMLGRGFSLAVQSGLMKYRPPVASLHVSNVRRFILTDEMVDAILAHLPPDERDVAEMALLIGWRRSEILGLRWENVDLSARVIRLEPGTTKSGEGRTLPYSKFPQLSALVERRRRKTVELELRLGERIPFVFHRRGEPIKGIRYAWARALKHVGLTGPVFHDFRRAAARNMVRSGIPIRVAMAVLGHKTRSMFDRYHIVTEDDVQDGLARYSVRLYNTRLSARGKLGASLPGMGDERAGRA